jgi:hypothetical protein
MLVGKCFKTSARRSRISMQTCNGALEVDRTGSGLCLVAGFGIVCVKSLGYTTTLLVQLFPFSNIIVIKTAG